MTGARTRFALALALFLAWLSWLAVAYYEKGKHPVLSRSQLLAATRLVVADITPGADGLPQTLTVVETIKGEPVTGTLNVPNLSSALTPGAQAFAGAGRYLVPLVGDGRDYRVADPAPSPGYPEQAAQRPRIYAWDEATRKQLAALGVGS